MNAPINQNGDLHYLMIVANNNERTKWSLESKWAKYETNEHYKDMIDSDKAIRTFRTYMFKKSMSDYQCKLCGITIENLSHIFWECKYVKEFWSDYKKYQSVKSTFQKDMDRLPYYVLLPKIRNTWHIQGNTSKCNVSTNCKLPDEYYRDVILPAKHYLFVCLEVGQTPSYVEYQNQMVKLFSDHPARLGCFFNLNYEQQLQQCSNDIEIIEKKRELGLTKRYANNPYQDVVQENYCLRCTVKDGWVQFMVRHLGWSVFSNLTFY